MPALNAPGVLRAIDSVALFAPGVGEPWNVTHASPDVSLAGSTLYVNHGRNSTLLAAT